MTEPETIKLKPNRSEPLSFKGWLIASTEWDTKQGEWMSFEIYRTVGGALIVAVEGSIPGAEDRTDLKATVIELEPGEAWDGDKPPQRMVWAALQALDWHDRARSMVKKQLSWRMERVVA